MRLIRQKKPFSVHDTFLLRVWRKRVYIEGWYVQVQIGKRAWLIMPNDQPAPKNQVKS